MQWTLTSLVPLRSKPFPTEAPSVDLQRRLTSITNQLHACVVVTAPRKLPQKRKSGRDLVSKKTNLEKIVSNLHSCNHTARGHTKEPESHVLVHLNGVTNHVKVIEQIPDVDGVVEGSIGNCITISRRNCSRSNENTADIPQLLNAGTGFQKLRLQEKTVWADGHDCPIDCSLRSQNWTSPANEACDMNRNDDKQSNRNQSKTEPPNDVVVSAPRKRRLSEPTIDISPKIHQKRNAFSDTENNGCAQANDKHKPRVTDSLANGLTTKDRHCGNETKTGCRSTQKANACGSLVGKPKRMAKRVLNDDFIYF